MNSFQHRPVMSVEVIEALQPRSGGFYVDCTVGGGGHAELILERSAPDGRLLGCDRDEEAIAAARERLGRYGERVELRHGNYNRIGEWVAPGTAEGMLIDLGVSSPQLDRAYRGFSFQADGPLDMRMDRSGGRTAAEWVNEASRDELARIFWEFGEERQARRVAAELERERQKARFETTGQLARFIEGLIPRRGQKIHPATRIFQALRIAVNDELGSLKTGLDACWKALKRGGRLAVITFHSLEDRIVKQFGRALEKDYEVSGPVDRPEFRLPRAPLLRWAPRKAIQPSLEETRSNPRARSAQLRVMEKLA